MAAAAPKRKQDTVTESRAPLPELGRLGRLAGHWRVEGDAYTDPHGAALHWKSDERYEWLPGERFLVNRWDARVGERSFRGMAVMGHDSARGYFAAFYDNAGNCPVYRVSVEDEVVYLDGERQRAMYKLAADGQSMQVHWDVRQAGGWQPLCNLVAKRI